ncbi:predicted protein [Postia placenta Mad-698-R]|nr:predicted protein [Postia placenta Mad-698-R]
MDIPVDWHSEDDALMLDMSPSTSNVPLIFVTADSAHTASAPSIIVYALQEVTLADVRKDVARFHKLSMPAHFICLTWLEAFCAGAPVFSELPFIPGVSADGDRGVPFVPLSNAEAGAGGA